MDPKQKEELEMMRKVTVNTKSNCGFITILPLDKVHELLKKIEKTPDGEFIDIFAFGKEERTGNDNEANVRAGEIALVTVETVSNIVVPTKSVQIQQIRGGQSA